MYLVDIHVFIREVKRNIVASERKSHQRNWSLRIGIEAIDTIYLIRRTSIVTRITCSTQGVKEGMQEEKI